MFVLEVLIGHRDNDGHEVGHLLDPGLVTFEHLVPSVFGKVGNSDLQLEHCPLKLLNFLLDIFRIKIPDVRFEPSFLKFGKFINIVPKKFPIVEFSLNILKFLIGSRHNFHQLLYLDIRIIFFLLF